MATEKTPLREDLDKLTRLQEIDSERDKLTRQRAHLDTGAGHQARAGEAATAANAAHAASAEASRSLKDAELELASMEQKLKQYEQRMRSGQLTNAREIANTEREINQLHRLRNTLDEKILALMDQVETTRESAAKADAQSRQSEQDASTQKALHRAQADEIDAQLARLVEQRAGASAAIGDPALLRRYEALRARPANHGVALAQIVEMHCGGCHQQVSSGYADRVRDGRELVSCENCGRILA